MVIWALKVEYLVISRSCGDGDFSQKIGEMVISTLKIW